jgi:glycosyltransferase involved in cell wall biosynthesis
VLLFVACMWWLNTGMHDQHKPPARMHVRATSAGDAPPTANAGQYPSTAVQERTTPDTWADVGAGVGVANDAAALQPLQQSRRSSGWPGISWLRGWLRHATTNAGVAAGGRAAMQQPVLERAPLFLHGWRADAYRAAGDVPVVVVAHAHWLGIRSATEMLALPTALRDDQSGEEWDDALLSLLREWRVAQVVINGFPPRSLALARRLHEAGVRVHCVYHGSFVQHVQNEDERRAFAAIVTGLNEGSVAGLGLVKNEMVQVATELGLRAMPIGNMVVRRDALQGPRFSTLDGRVHIGVLGGRTLGKNVIMQLMAACTFPEVVVHVLTLDYDLPYMTHCRAEVRQHAPRPALHFQRLISQMDINLYVSMFECQPMVALESIAAGVPCIISDTSTIYQSAPALQQLLVCPQQDAADAVRGCIARVAHALGPELSDRLRDHVATVNYIAVSSFAQLLDLPASLLFGWRTDLDLEWAGATGVGADALPTRGSAATSLYGSLSPRRTELRTRWSAASAAVRSESARAAPLQAITPIATHTPVMVAQRCEEVDWRGSPSAGTAALTRTRQQPQHPQPQQLARPQQQPQRSAHSRPTVVLVTYELAGVNQGGAGTVIHGVAASMWSAGWRVVLLTSMPKKETTAYLQAQRSAGVGEDRLMLMSLADLAPSGQPGDVFCSVALQWAKGAEQLYRVLPYDVIEFFEYAAPATVLLVRRYEYTALALPASVKVVVRIHGSLEWIMTAEQMPFDARQNHMFLMERFAMAAADFVLAPTPQMGELYVRECHVQPRRLLVGTPPVLASLQVLGDTQQCAEQRLQRQHLLVIGEGELRFLVLGKVQRIKNPGLVVRAALALLAEQPHLRFTVTFVGPVIQSGSLLPDPMTELRALIPPEHAARFEFRERVERRDFGKVVCAYDVGVVASRFESFNMVAHELTYLGMPLLISDFAGFQKYFSARNAFVFRRGSVLALKEAMLRALQKSPASLRIEPLHYEDPLEPYRCVLAAPVPTAQERAAWWNSEEAVAAHTLLDSFSCADSSL